MFRRYHLLACVLGERGLIERTEGMIRKIELSHASKGPSFFKSGHHCGGYLDGPYVHASLRENPRPWDGASARTGSGADHTAVVSAESL